MSVIKEKIRGAFVGEVLINKLHEIEGMLLPQIISDEKAVKHYYKKCTGKDINLDLPETFCEKINWYKLNGHDPLMVKCADKVGLREFVSKNGYAAHLNEMYGVYSSVDEIDVSKLPEQFVIKAAHGTHMQIIVKDKSTVNWKQAKCLMRSWLKQDIYWRGREWVYKDMPHRIIIEKYIEDKFGELRDYKFFCFHGKPEYMQYDIGRFKNEQYRNYYDMNLKQLHITDGVPGVSLNSEPVSRNVFVQMQQMAQKLSEPFQQVRIDFYFTNNQILVGEMTFFDGGGSTIFSPDEWNYIFAKNWKVKK